MFVYYKCYVTIELTFLKELMLVKQANQKNATFVTIGIFYIKALCFNQMSAMGCHDLWTLSGSEGRGDESSSPHIKDVITFESLTVLTWKFMTFLKI